MWSNYAIVEIDGIWILPINSTIRRHNVVKLRHCAINLCLLMFEMMIILFCVILVAIS